MTLDEFIATRRPPNAYVEEVGFDALYVRHGHQLIDGKLVPTLDLANMTATHPGQGAFTNLVTRLRRDYPHLNLYVESVLNSRFRKMLPRLGFVQVVGVYPPSFVLRGQ